MSSMRTSTPDRARRRLGDDILTVACVYRTGGRLYSPRYVEVLRDMVQRNLSLPHRFVCLSDDPNVPCQRIPLITNWPGFYSKLELFRAGLFRGPVLYFDLDTVIHGLIDGLARLACELPFGCVSDPLGCHMNSSVQTFTVDCAHIFDRFHKTSVFDRHIRSHLWFVLRRAGLERLVAFGSSYGDQGFSEMCLNDAGVPITHVDHVLPDLFSTFNFTAGAATQPKGSVCLMMGRPKPHEVPAGWVERHWRVKGTEEHDFAHHPEPAPGHPRASRGN